MIITLIVLDIGIVRSYSLVEASIAFLKFSRFLTHTFFKPLSLIYYIKDGVGRISEALGCNYYR